MIKNENVEGEPAYDETYRRGPVVMRGPMIPKDNTYANLLAPEESTDWLHADPWRVLRIQAEFVDGFGALAELGVDVGFGGQRVDRSLVGLQCELGVSAGLRVEGHVGHAGHAPV